MDPSYPRARWNLFAFGSDTILFSIAWQGIFNASIVLPAFLSQLGASTTIVGLVLALIGVGHFGRDGEIQPTILGQNNQRRATFHAILYAFAAHASCT